MARFFARGLTGLAVVMSGFFTTATPMSLAAAQQVSARDEQQKDKASGDKDKRVSKDARASFIRKAQIWSPTDIPAMSLRLGPQGKDAFQPGEAVTCDYVVVHDPSGSSPKFHCAIAKDDIVKVRYGAENGEVEGSVLATRLLWALGFVADRVYPVRITCRGCSADPWTMRDPVRGEHVFDPAAIERKPDGDEVKTDKKAGWAWRELDSVDETQGGAPKDQRDALKLLAVLMQHTDTKVEQQRLLCLSGDTTDEGGCSRPFMMLHDVGLTFGHANMLNKAKVGSVNFDEWASTPIWRDARACVGHMRRSYSGTLNDPQISEAGRKFLADLLVQLTDQQLRDLFGVARVDQRSRKPGTNEPPASVDEWVNVFKQKRDEIVNNRCKL